jgi:hypothetical protein
LACGCGCASSHLGPSWRIDFTHWRWLCRLFGYKALTLVRYVVFIGLLLVEGNCSLSQVDEGVQVVFWALSHILDKLKKFFFRDVGDVG